MGYGKRLLAAGMLLCVLAAGVLPAKADTQGYRQQLLRTYSADPENSSASIESILSQLEGVKVAATFIMVDRKERGKGDKLAMQEVEDEFGFPVYSVVDVYDIIEYLEEDPANAENVARIKNYLAVNGAKA